MNKNIDPRVTKARTALVMDSRTAFYGALALRLEIIEDPSFDTMAVDGRRLFYNPSFLNELTPQQTIGVLIHEVEHCAHKHHLRRNGRDLGDWNVACDLALNGAILKAGFVLPEGMLIDPQYDGLSAEDIYRVREMQRKQEEAAQQQKQQQDQQSGEGNGSGEGEDGQPDDAEQDKQEGDENEEGTEEGDKDSGQQGGEKDAGGEDQAESNGDAPGDDEESSSGDGGKSDDPDSDDPADAGASDTAGEDDVDASEGKSGKDSPDPGRCGGVIDAADTPAERAEIEAEWDVAVAQAINVATKAAGGLPGYLKNLVAEIRTPKQDWRAILRQFVDPSSRKDYSWSRPNRRFSTAPYVLPGLVTDGVNHVGVVIDTSGSIDLHALSQFRAELQAAIDDGAVDRFTVLMCDTQVNSILVFENGDELVFNPDGGGGTLFQPAFDWVNENEPDVSCLVFFTDMATGDWPFLSTPSFPVLWACYCDPRDYKQYQVSVPFGECIDVAAD